MGQVYKWACKSCGHEVTTGGAWEFYRDKSAKRRAYGHPVPVSKVAKKSGIKGFTTDRYCPECGVVRKVIDIEFLEPQDYITAWISYDAAPEPCPTCGTWLLWEVKVVHAPSAAKGC